jgi:hypothetical protein
MVLFMVIKGQAYMTISFCLGILLNIMESFDKLSPLGVHKEARPINHRSYVFIIALCECLKIILQNTPLVKNVFEMSIFVTISCLTPPVYRRCLPKI